MHICECNYGCTVETPYSALCTTCSRLGHITHRQRQLYVYLWTMLCSGTFGFILGKIF
jgi:hypothetical protein